MALEFTKSLKALLHVVYTFSPTSARDKLQCLKQVSKMPHRVHQDIFEYHIALLFTLTHAETEPLLQLAEVELSRLARFLKKNGGDKVFTDSGLPYSTMLTRFTQDAFNDLVKNKDVHIELESLNNNSFNLNTFLNITMPRILKEYTTAGMSNDDILDVLGVQPGKRFEFLLKQINEVQIPPLAKDLLWQSLQSFFIVKGKSKAYSKSYNRLSLQPYFYHKDLIKQLDQFKLIQKKIPPAAILNEQARENLAFVIRNSMPLAMREIDTITYMDTTTIKVFHLERGLSLAVYSPRAERQLPMQSFIGCSLFKNSYPIAYGATWVFGECALFGLNLLEEFRGGESKYIMTQIMRVFIQLYKISYYEIEPFQFGNEEAIHTGAFWFYYKYGFRSKDQVVNRLALKEVEKMKRNKQYRSSHATLRKLAGYNIALQLGNHKPVHREDILEKINHVIAHTYKGDSWTAIAQAKLYFRKQLPFKKPLTPLEEEVFEEIALWAYAYKIDDGRRLSLMQKMIGAKINDTQLYNKLVLKTIALS